MIRKSPIIPRRIRKIEGNFAFIEHRFLQDGFLQSLAHHESLLYIFLILAADRIGLSYYGYDKICMLLKLTVDEYIDARDGLIDKDLIAFDGHLFQVLSLPERPLADKSELLLNRKQMELRDPATVRRLIECSLGKP
ncbi:MAG: hypothetical protein GY757_20390 [bacterium]|nr:hypothetical protein [bacterium]